MTIVPVNNALIRVMIEVAIVLNVKEEQAPCFHKSTGNRILSPPFLQNLAESVSPARKTFTLTSTL
jgi:hypothetical protein